MCNEIIDVTGNIANDIIMYSNQISEILADKIRCKRVTMKLDLQEHIEPMQYMYMNINLFEDSDIICLKLNNVNYLIYHHNSLRDEWVIWQEGTEIEIVLHSDWDYRDLLGAISLLGHGAKARHWNKIVISEKIAEELGYNRLEFKIKEVRLRDSNAFFE